MRAHLRLLALSLASLGLACSKSTSEPLTVAPNDAGPDVVDAPDVGSTADFIPVPRSCAFDCPAGSCAEDKTPYPCGATAEWSKLPHDSACKAWDGTYPTPVKGKCSASLATGEAAKFAGTDATTGVTILPDGRRLSPAGSEWLFDEADLPSGLPSAIVAIPGSKWVVVVDTGYGPHAVRVIDSTKIDTGKPVVSYVKFADPSTLNSGIAFVAPDRLYVATDDGDVQALTLDVASGKIARDDARSLKLPDAKGPTGDKVNWYASGVAASADGKHLVVSGVRSSQLLVFDIDSASATYGKQLGAVDVGAVETFGVAFDPHDPVGRYAYVSLWATSAVAEVDIGDPTAPKLTRTFATDKDPEGVAFLDARFMAIANDHGDTIALVDRVSGGVTEVPVDATTKLHGAEPSTLAYDEANKRLYATLAGDNAIAAFDVDLSSTPPKLTPTGKLPTSYWPSGVVVLADGGLVIANMRGRSTGPLLKTFGIDDGDVMSHIRGGVQHVSKPSVGDLVAGDAKVKANDVVAALAGAPTVSCEGGAPYDFPIPDTNTKGASKVIDHVFYIVRENKTFDGVLGDLPGMEGKKELAFTTPARMDAIWANFRALVKTFATSDNDYTSAELSIQGHVWTTTGRTNDYVERTWAMDGDGRSPRHNPIPEANTLDVAKPTEGSLFDWLDVNKVPYAILGEAAGLPRKKPGVANPVDGDYPGGFVQSIPYPDVEKACYVAARLRVLCDLPGFVYQTLPNDHTQGVGLKTPTPETMIGLNDEATGMLVDAISHSPYWASSLIVIVEDDPTQGGDHIENHRIPMAIVSPWVKRGYVSHTHIDISSMHKLFAHVLGLPYSNATIENAALPLDMFTSTPDYTPYVYKPRSFPSGCGDTATAAELKLQSSWDFRREDVQPGLDAQVARWLRGEQLKALTPAMEADLVERRRRMEMNLPPIAIDDDD